MTRPDEPNTDWEDAVCRAAGFPDRVTHQRVMALMRQLKQLSLPLMREVYGRRGITDRTVKEYARRLREDPVIGPLQREFDQLTSPLPPSDNPKPPRKRRRA